MLIFARYPRAGQVKTRLRTRFSDRRILRLYRAFLEDTLDLSAGLPVARFLFLADCSPQEADALAARPPYSEVAVRIQEGRDLGQRMWNAYCSVFQQHKYVVFLGADTPALPPRLLEESFEHLRRVPVVIGPSTDGGYYLLGLSAPRRRLFQDMPWGTSQVLASSLQRLQAGELHLLPPYSDTDTPQDLDRLQAELRLHPERAPLTAGQLDVR